MRAGERGAGLLDVLVALAVLGAAGASLAAGIAAALAGERVLTERESEITSASRVLTATTLLSRTDLDRRIGRRQVGEFDVNVQRPERGLYRIAISSTAAPETELMVTVVYRPEPVSP